MTILDRATPEPNTGCFLWEGAMGKRGYGNVWIVRDGVKVCALAHRQSWEENIGPIPPGMNVLHKCDVPLCVNPDHLFLGTQADNMADMDKKGRRGNMWITAEDVDYIRAHPHSRGYRMSLSEKFKISPQYITDIRANRWREGSGS